MARHQVGYAYYVLGVSVALLLTYISARLHRPELEAPMQNVLQSTLRVRFLPLASSEALEDFTAHAVAGAEGIPALEQPSR